MDQTIWVYDQKFSSFVELYVLVRLYFHTMLSMKTLLAICQLNNSETGAMSKFDIDLLYVLYSVSTEREDVIQC